METQDNQWIANQDMTDEMRIQFAIDEFYENMKTLTKDKNKIIKIKLMRNNIINMVDTYLKKFKNESIMEDFYNKLNRAKDRATRNGYVDKYQQYMGELRIVQEFKGIQENIADKLAEQLIEMFRNSEVVERVKDSNEN